MTKIVDMHRINEGEDTALYCTGVDVDYAPDGQPSFYKDGNPVHTKMTVSFVEDHILTKGDILQGM